MYRTRSPRALLRSWPADEVNALKPLPQADRPPDPPSSPSPHLLTSKDSQQPWWGQEGTSCPNSGREGRVSGTHTVPPTSPLVLPQVQVTGSSQESRFTAAWSQGLGGRGQRGRERKRDMGRRTLRKKQSQDRVEKERQEGNVQRNREKTGDKHGGMGEE